MQPRSVQSLSIAACASLALTFAAAAETPPGDASAQPPADAAAPAAADKASGATPKATAEAAEKGTLTSPYASDPKTVADEGHKIYMAAGCNGCHGGGGGGGMGPPLTNPVWVYGKDDDTLFRVIALGSDALQKQGYNRKGSESVVGPMPAMGEIVKSDDDMWKLIAWVRTVNPDSKAPSTAESAQ
jgi:mono/diheme cytochrome c family protein